MNRCWINSGTVFRDTDADSQIFKGNLPFGVYKPELTRSGYVLNKISDKFIFDYKIYDIDHDFINRVITYWNNSNRNLGILLNGIKGSGKTVTGKLIANQLKLPIILIDDNASELIDYLKTFDFPCVLFFDEYEKVFVKDDSDDPDYSILSLMDGASSDFNRKLFILTTNDLEIDDNLISRPSRIRYCKEYKTLSVEIIKNYINDNLNDKSKVEELCEVINELEDCTIDILKAIIEDMNIFNCSAKEVQSYMNLTKKEYEYSYIRIIRYDKRILRFVKFFISKRSL
jgi:SpoVK/Ycf46/Vps4 family AAA+-type ATPase